MPLDKNINGNNDLQARESGEPSGASGGRIVVTDAMIEAAQCAIFDNLGAHMPNKNQPSELNPLAVKLICRQIVNLVRA